MSGETEPAGPASMMNVTSPPPSSYTPSISARDISIIDSRSILQPVNDSEQTSRRTHNLLNAARLIFQISHGLMLLCVSASLDHVDKANWWGLFAPALVGDFICVAMLLSSWFVSCPYIKLCLSERTVRVNESPSILTEVLPEIVLTVPGLIFLVFVICGEYSFCKYLRSSELGKPDSLSWAVALLIIAALLAVCQGTLFTTNSTLWLSAGTGLLFAAVSFAATQDPSSPPLQQALPVLPVILAVAAILLASISRMCHFTIVISPREKCLLRIEALLLFGLLLGLIAVAEMISTSRMHQAGPVGIAVGILLCLLPIPRAWLLHLEAQYGIFEERVFRLEARNRATTIMGDSSVVEVALTASMAAHLI
eukprot:TRINITY_DN27161_c0_g2_i1.p1 TRINITY_DN27161_c0_g2~~TRINITY_DN27161_c0_g2_i1.p1  ORF type:complete len:401 (-),score=27.37 TRINITY_DN27161_c0_g2_i1:84-1184(-)